MDNQSSPKLDLTNEQLAKVAKARASHQSVKVDENWLFIAEFGYYYGWAGVVAIRSNEIGMDEATMLLVGARKVWSGAVYDHATATLIGTSTARSKKPSQQFKKLTRSIMKQAKADVV